MKPGYNCWRLSRADRLRWIIDGQAYFAAVAKAVRSARRSIYIAGWDIDSRVSLVRGPRHRRKASQLGRFLDRTVAQRPGLEAWLLVWDFAMIYAMEREPLPVFKLGWSTHRRVHFHMDHEHPVGGSQHQKIVVIDDRLAFVGGFDLTKWRWDTPEHKAGDPRRTDPGGKPYGPFHDVQVMVEGPAAADLGQLFRQRWRWATGRRLQAPAQPKGRSPWPKKLKPHASDCQVALARTLPAYKGRDKAAEVRQLFLDSIAEAKDHIYIENQYFTSHVAAEALAARLAEPDGPEVVLVMPKQGPDWLEQSTMDVLRARVLRRLRQADQHGRLGVYHPVAPGEPAGVNVHAKVMVVDGWLARVGSANLSNRSMGLDSECDLALADGPAAEALRDTLLAEHLDVEPQEVSQALAKSGSLLGAVEGLRGRGRSLAPLEAHPPPWAETLELDSAYLDPEEPVALERMIQRFGPVVRQERSWAPYLKAAAVLAVVLALAALWRWGPMAQWADADALHKWVSHAAQAQWGPAMVLGGFAVGGVLMFPVTVLIAATALVFDPWAAAAYAWAGATLSGVVVYGLGWLLGRNLVRRVGGQRLNSVSHKLAKRGLWAVMLIRLVPIAPYSLVNLAAGASQIRLIDFVLGTALGLMPGVAGVVLFADRLAALFRNPTWENWLVLAAVAALVMGAAWVVKRLLARPDGGEGDEG